MTRLPWQRKRRGYRNSLTSRYLLIVCIAMLFLPIVFPLSGVMYGYVNDLIQNQAVSKDERYTNGVELETLWHAEAEALNTASPTEIEERLIQLKDMYPEASMFWVDGENRTRLTLSNGESVPALWSAVEAVAFMKRAVNGDPFTSVAFIGGEWSSSQGFMVIQLPRKHLYQSANSSGESILYFILLMLIALMFIVISWLFFVRIRKRLLRLRDAMTSSNDHALPQPVVMNRSDEIGQLEAGYNAMVEQLAKSRHREQEEAELRKSLIANLSHDLRTPLTVIRSHIFSMEQEALSINGRKSLHLMESKIQDLGALIDNLLSYSLLTSGKVLLQREPLDLLRLVRECAAAWYPLWEKEGIELDIELQDGAWVWRIDELWFKRLLDNLFQNVVRHAKGGGYIGIHRTVLDNGVQALLISDKGPGMDAKTPGTGSGIGLAIVHFLAKEMEIDCQIQSGTQGTVFTLSQPAGREGGREI
ncbi:sensor histidine kinase [Paenibacillus sp. JSM ZJ436]|uniref:sensor histidine kinase n=1 Tax=Paenibacillus sp. JSM ZJ436 TaxID=3376190 RepID=UPI00379D60C7